MQAQEIFGATCQSSLYLLRRLIRLRNPSSLAEAPETGPASAANVDALSSFVCASRYSGTQSPRRSCTSATPSSSQIIMRLSVYIKVALARATLSSTDDSLKPQAE